MGPPQNDGAMVKRLLSLPAVLSNLKYGKVRMQTNNSLILNIRHIIHGPWTVAQDPWPMINDQWSMSHDQWPVINDPWSMTNDPRPMTHAKYPGPCPMTHDPWLMSHEPEPMTKSHLHATIETLYYNMNVRVESFYSCVQINGPKINDLRPRTQDTEAWTYGPWRGTRICIE